MVSRKIPPRVRKQLELAHVLMMSGDLEEAELAVEQLVAEYPDLPEIAFLQGQLESAHGEVAAAAAHYLRAVELDPDDPQWLVQAAGELLRDGEDPTGALTLAERVAREWPRHESCAAALLIVAKARRLLEDDAGAREALQRVKTDDARQLTELGLLWDELGELTRAAECYRMAIARGGILRDLYHALGACLHDLGKPDEATEAWLRALELDREMPRPPSELTEDELLDLAEGALRKLPGELRKRLIDVPRVVEDAPSEDFVRQGVDPRTLALFEGILVAELPPSEAKDAVPDALVLYLRNLENEVSFRSMRDFSPDRAALRELVRVSILAETKRFFALDDRELE
jgi:tetratricopeptide (TPR) repeat protein